MNDQNVNSMPVAGSDPVGIPNNIPSSLQDANFSNAAADGVAAEVPVVTPEVQPVQPQPIQPVQPAQPVQSEVQTIVQQDGEKILNQTSVMAPGSADAAEGDLKPVSSQAVSNEAIGVDNIQFQPQNPQVPSIQEPAPPAITPSAMPPQGSSGKKILMTIILVFVVLLLGTGGLVFATEAGYLKANLDKYYTKIGLQNLWGGLPYDGKQAMAVTAVKMSGLDTLHMSGKLSATISQTTDADIPFQTLIQKNNFIASSTDKNGAVLGESTSANTNINLSDESDLVDPKLLNPENNPETAPVDSSQDITLALNIDGDLSEKASEFSLTLDASSLTDELSMFGLSSLASNALRADFLMVDEKLYIRIPALSVVMGSKNNKWYGIDLKDVTKDTDLKDKVVKKITGAGDVVKSGEKVGVETIAGVSTNKYHLELDTAKLGQLFSNTYNKELSNYTSTLDVWIGKSDHLIHQFILVSEGNYEGTKTTLKLEMNLSKFNEVLGISAPDASQINEDGIMGIQQDILGLSTGTSEQSGGDSLVTAREKARDAQRKSDLRSIKTALEVYAADQPIGTTAIYPIAAERIKLSDAGNVVEKALTSGENPILKTLPIDPSPEKYYYGYRSVDGTSYELTAVLEDKSATGEGIAKSGDLVIFTLTNE